MQREKWKTKDLHEARELVQLKKRRSKRQRQDRTFNVVAGPVISHREHVIKNTDKNNSWNSSDVASPWEGKRALVYEERGCKEGRGGGGGVVSSEMVFEDSRLHILNSHQDASYNRSQQARLDSPVYARDIIARVAVTKRDLCTGLLNTQSHYCFLIIIGSQSNGACTKELSSNHNTPAAVQNTLRALRYADENDYRLFAAKRALLKALHKIYLAFELMHAFQTNYKGLALTSSSEPRHCTFHFNLSTTSAFVTSLPIRVFLNLATGMKVRGEWEIAEETHRPTALSGTVPKCEDPELPGRGLRPDRLGKVNSFENNQPLKNVTAPICKYFNGYTDLCAHCKVSNGEKRERFVSLPSSGRQRGPRQTYVLSFRFALYKCVNKGRSPNDKSRYMPWALPSCDIGRARRTQHPISVSNELRAQRRFHRKFVKERFSNFHKAEHASRRLEIPGYRFFAGHAEFALLFGVRLNVTVLCALEPKSFLHWLLHRGEFIPFLSELHVIDTIVKCSFIDADLPRACQIKYCSMTSILERQIRSESPISTTARTPVLLVSVIELTVVLLVHTTPDTAVHFTAFIIGRSSTNGEPS
ncbi:hypothetical protein PR048_031168 [Dryococelus australis]|uniref:Uncharacterized protein n=1 Tax=Dryococelus australis TaxID=614101 RepID=A0ABQ9G4I7_9NEOP|nr:hypothetical protein PR048_031168 [Dryococelus australis]